MQKRDTYINNFKTFENLQKYRIKDILQLPASKKYKSLKNKNDYNKNILKLVYNSSEYQKELYLIWIIYHYLKYIIMIANH